MQLVQIKVKRISHLKADPNSAILEVQEVSGERTFSIVIGMEEAAAIAAYIAHIKLEAPLMHDLFKNTLDAFRIQLKKVVVTELTNGYFISELSLQTEDGLVCTKQTARISDAISMALRFNKPIFIEETLFQQLTIAKPSKIDIANMNEDTDLTSFTNETLDNILQKLVDKEDYEKAVFIRNEINRRQQNKQ